MANHYHAYGELGEGNPCAGPDNGACRCEEHIAPPLKATRARPTCPLECYLCARARQLRERLARKSTAS